MNTALQTGPVRQSKSSWPAYGAALWSLIFAFFHTVWAAGWYVGLWPQETYKKIFQQRWTLIYDEVVIGICLLGVAVELALVQPWGHRIPRWLVGFLAWGGTAALVVRGGGSLIQCAYELVRGKFVVGPMLVWEFWFYLGALLFVLSLRQYQRASRLARTV